MSMKTIEQISNHLEFLGYKVEQRAPNENGRVLCIAKHATRNNVLYVNLSDNLIHFRVTLHSNKKHSVDMDVYVNKVNSALTTSKVYVDEEDDGINVNFETAYMGEYTKDIFAEFFDYLEDAQRQFYALDNFDSIFT